MAKTKAPSDLADNRFVRALIDRLVETEKQVLALRKELENHVEAWAEQLPWLTNTGELRFKQVLVEYDDGTEKFEVVLKPQCVTKEP